MKCRLIKGVEQWKLSVELVVENTGLFFTVGQPQCHKPSLRLYRCRQEQCREKQIINHTHSLLNKVGCIQHCHMCSASGIINNWCQKSRIFFLSWFVTFFFFYSTVDKFTLTTSLVFFSFGLRRQCRVCVDAVSLKQQFFLNLNSVWAAAFKGKGKDFIT